MSSASIDRQSPRTLPDASRGGRLTGFTPSIDPLRVIRRHWMWIALSAIFGAVLGTAAFFVFGKVYQLYSAQVMFEVMPGLANSKDMGNVDTTTDELIFRIAQTETYMLTSRVVLEAAVKKPEVKQTDWYKQYQIQSDGKTIDLADDAVDDLTDQLRTSVLRGTNLFTISWSNTNVADVPSVLNAVADTYMDLRKSRDDKMYGTNYELFNRKLKETQNTLDNLTQEASQFIVEHQVTTTNGTYESPEKFQKDKYSELLASAQAGLSNSETHYDIVSAKLQHTMEYDSDDIVKAEQDITMQSHLSNLMALESELIRLTQTRQADDMMVQNMKSRVDAAKKQRDKQRDEIITRNLNAELQLSQQDVERYKRMMEDLEKKGKESTGTIVDLAKYQAQFDLMQDHRHSLEETRQKQMELLNELELMRLRADSSRVTMAQKAQRPRIPSFPKWQVLIPLGTLLMLFVVTGFIFLREIMDQRVKSVSDLSVIPGGRVIGSIPELGEDPTETSAAEFVIRKHPYSVLAESYRQALSPVLQAAERLEYQTILLAGGLPGAGTTTVTTNLASCATAAGKKVLVIDANFRRPRLAAVMDVPADGAGIGDLIVGEATLEEAIAEGPDGISVIGPGRPANRIIDRLNNGKLESILAELRGRFDLILLDAPPIVVAGDALVLANKVDAAILVVRAHQEHRGCVARVMNLLSQGRSDFLGVLLNRPRGTAGGYLKKNYVAMAEYTSSSAS